MSPIAGIPGEGSECPPFAHELGGIIRDRQDEGGWASAAAAVQAISATRRGSQEPVDPSRRFHATHGGEYGAGTQTVATEQGEEVGQERDEVGGPGHRGRNESQQESEEAGSEKGGEECRCIEHLPATEAAPAQEEAIARFRVDDAPDDVLEGFLFDVRRSARYHERRCAFFTVLHRLTNITAILLAGVVLAELSASHASPWWIRALAVIGGLFSASDLVVGFGPRGDAHREFKRRFVALERKTLKGGDLLQKLTDKRLNIETEEPPIYRALDVLCHNEVCRALGKDKCEFYKVPRRVRWTAQVLHWNDYSFAALEPRPISPTEGI